MKLFLTTQRNLAALGFIPNQNHLLNKQHICGILIGVSTTISQFLYIFREADTTEDYMASIFTVTAVIAITLNHMTIVFKTTELYDFIENIQAVTNESE